MQIRGWQLWGANGRPPSNCRRPVARRNLRAVLIGADADLGHDEFHQFRPWRIRHARHVCRIPGRGLAACPALFTLAAAFALLVLGIAIYLSLIRHVIRGPMLAQILSTFGLALLLRYT